MFSCHVKLLLPYWDCHAREQEDIHGINLKAVCRVRAAQDAIPTSSKKSAEWFLENEGVIRPALKKQNLALGVWLATKRDEDRKLYLKEKRQLQCLIRKLKNQWFSSKVAEIERSMRRARSAWESTRQLQQACRQRATTIHPTYREGRGRWSLQGDRWRRHFDWMFWVCSTWVWLKQQDSTPCIVSWVCHQLQKNWRVLLELSRAGSVVERMDWHQASQEGRGWWKEWTGTRLDKRVCAVYLEYVLELFEAVWVSGVVYRRLG